MKRDLMNRRHFLSAGVGLTAATLWTPSLAGSNDPTRLSLKEASALLRKRALSPVDLTNLCLERIRRLDPSLNAFITVTADQALTTAREMEAEQRHGKWRGPLHGIPIALKDNIDTAGVHTTAASELFKDRVPADDAEVVRRLKSAGAVVLGKLNLHEFAYGGTSAASWRAPESHRPPPRRDLSKVIHFVRRHQKDREVADRRKMAAPLLVGMGLRKKCRVGVRQRLGEPGMLLFEHAKNLVLCLETRSCPATVSRRS